MASIRHYPLSRNSMVSIRHTVHVYTTLHLGVVHSVYVAKSDVVNPTRGRRLYDLHFCIQRTVHVAQFTDKHATHCARSYDIRLCDVPTVHVAKPDDVPTTLGFVAIQVGLQTTLGFVAKLDSGVVHRL